MPIQLDRYTPSFVADIRDQSYSNVVLLYEAGKDHTNQMSKYFKRKVIKYILSNCFYHQHRFWIIIITKSIFVEDIHEKKRMWTNCTADM